MKIKERKIDDLIGAEYNPRELTEKQYSDLKDSLMRFGLVDPILVNVNPERKDILIGGHQRLKVWKALGNDTISTIELDLTLEKEKELNIRLNKNSGQFDKDMLANLFDTSELLEWGFEEYEFGFTDDVDYSILDDEDVSDELGDLEGGVKKAIQIEFEAEDYVLATELIKFWRDNGAYIGGLIIEKLNAEKEKLK